MSKNDEIREKIEGYREKIFAVDEEYWNGKNSTPKQKEDWRSQYNDPIVYDGTIGEDDIPCDLLFLLKESTNSGYQWYGKESGHKSRWFPSDRTWDFIQMTNDLVATPDLRIETVWPDLCCWTKVFRDKNVTFESVTFKSVSFESVKSFYNKEKNVFQNSDYSILHGTAIVNVKKTAGENSSEYKLLMSAAETYGDLLKEEIHIIHPKIILCCGTFDQAKALWKHQESDIQKLDCGAEYFYHIDDEEKIVVVSFCHPSARIGREVLFAYAKAVFEELENRKLIRQ